MNKAIRYAIIVAVVLLVLLSVGFILAGIFNVLLQVLYFPLIILAVFVLLSTFLLIYALLMLIQTITTVRNEIKPLIASVQNTVGSVMQSMEETVRGLRGTA